MSSVGKTNLIGQKRGVAQKLQQKNAWERGVEIIQNKLNTEIKDAKAAGKIIQDKAAQGNFMGALGSAADYASTKLKNSGYIGVSQAGEIIDLGTNLARSAKAIPQLLQQGKQDLRDARDIIIGNKAWVKRDSVAGLGSGVGKGGYGFVNGIVDIGTRMIMPGAWHSNVAEASHKAETWLDETYKTNNKNWFNIDATSPSYRILSDGSQTLINAVLIAEGGYKGINKAKVVKAAKKAKTSRATSALNDLNASGGIPLKAPTKVTHAFSPKTHPVGGNPKPVKTKPYSPIPAVKPFVPLVTVAGVSSQIISTHGSVKLHPANKHNVRDDRKFGPLRDRQTTHMGGHKINMHPDGEPDFVGINVAKSKELTIDQYTAQLNSYVKALKNNPNEYSCRYLYEQLRALKAYLNSIQNKTILTNPQFIKLQDAHDLALGIYIMAIRKLPKAKRLLPSVDLNGFDKTEPFSISEILEYQNHAPNYIAFGSGANKIWFPLLNSGSPLRAIGLPIDGASITSALSMQYEVNMLRALDQIGIPTPKNPFTRPLNDKGGESILAPKQGVGNFNEYPSNELDLNHHGKITKKIKLAIEVDALPRGSINSKDWHNPSKINQSQWDAMINNNTVEDFKLIRELVAKEKLEIYDFQLVIQPDGRIILLDPTEIFTGIVQKTDLLTLNSYIETVQNDLIRIATKGKSSSAQKVYFEPPLHEHTVNTPPVLPLNFAELYNKY
jgi:hypothetical protein